jgi:hypothetical protein
VPSPGVQKTEAVDSFLLFSWRIHLNNHLLTILFEPIQDILQALFRYKIRWMDNHLHNPHTMKKAPQTGSGIKLSYILRLA